MIRAPRLPEPEGFDARVRKPGERWLMKNPEARRLRPLWKPYREVLATGYGHLCGYAAMYDPTGGTVDHYRSVARHRELAYEWSNYRFASAIMNASKGARDEGILDPETVRAGWFEILLPSLQLRVTGKVPARLRDKAGNTLRQLGLTDGERVIRWRRSWYELYERGELTLEGLRTVAPLIAEAIVRASKSQP